MSLRPGRADVLSAVGFVLALPACGAAVVQPIAVGDGCPQDAVRGADLTAGEPTDHLIDDFEDGDMVVARVAGRDGNWTEGDDGTSQTFAMENSTRCTARGLHAGHFAGAGFTNWGANFTGVFRPVVAGKATPYDGRAYGGISFWAAVAGGADGGGTKETPVGLTTMDTAWNGGVCGTTCMDFYRTSVPLTNAWTRFEIRFADLKQTGFGMPQVPLRLDQLVGFIVWPAYPFDVWIDDLRFEP
jgi:hypothetical protein